MLIQNDKCSKRGMRSILCKFPSINQMAENINIQATKASGGFRSYDSPLEAKEEVVWDVILQQSAYGGGQQ